MSNSFRVATRFWLERMVKMGWTVPQWPHGY
jgi:hypothetical protein